MADVDHPGLIDIEMSSELARLVERFPLPAGVPDWDMNQAEIAEALDTTVNTVGKWLTNAVAAGEWADLPEFPVVQRGGQGRAYVLRLSHCHAWREHRDAIERGRREKSREAIVKMQASFLGIDTDQGESVLSPQERRALAEADIVHSKAAMLRRRLVQLDEVTGLLESVFQIIRDGVESMPDRMERELSLKPEQVDLVQRIGDDILSGMAAKIERAELREQDLSDEEMPDGILIR